MTARTDPHYAGAPTAHGPARSVAVTGSAPPAPTHATIPALRSVAVAAVAPALASLPAPALAHLAARGERIARAMGAPAPAGSLADRALAAVVEGRWTDRDGAAATASAWTRAARAADVSARWALDPAHTGSIPSARMRVRAPAPRPPVDGAPRPAPDALAGMLNTGRRAACARARSLVGAYLAGRKAGRNVTHLVREIRDLLASGDAEVIQAARDAGWRC